MCLRHYISYIQERSHTVMKCTVQWDRSAYTDFFWGYAVSDDNGWCSEVHQTLNNFNVWYTCMMLKWKYRTRFIHRALCYLWTADTGGINDNRQQLKNKNLMLRLVCLFHSALSLFSYLLLLKMSPQSSICARLLPPRPLLWICRKEFMLQWQSIMTASETTTMRFFFFF